MVCIGKNIANCSNPQFLLVMWARCPHCSRVVPALCTHAPKYLLFCHRYLSLGIGTYGFGIGAYHFAIGTYRLVIGTYCLGIGTYCLAIGSSCLAIGTYRLAIGTCR